MRLFLLTASLIATLGLTSCADHVSRIASVDPTPQDPIGPGDGSTVGGGGTGGGGGTLPSGGDGQTGGGTGGGGPTSGGSSTDGGKEGGGQGGNGPGGSPVPEPGTMLLVGTGLAGAALMRRRRKNGETPQPA